MTKRNRALLYALGQEDNTPQFDPDDVGPIEHQTIDPDHPETLQNLSLVEYSHLLHVGEQEVPFDDTPATDNTVTQEGFSDNVQNFKNWFQSSMHSEDAYLDQLLERFKALKPQLQAANDKAVNDTPISMFGDYTAWLTAGEKPMQSPQQIQHEVDRLSQLNTLMEKVYLPSYSAELKLAMEIISQGATDVDGAYERAYTINKLAPIKGFEAVLNKSGTTKLGSGKTVTARESAPYLGSMYLQAYPLGDSHERNVDRGEEMVALVYPKALRAKKVQLKAATRSEAIKIAEECTKMLEVANRYLDAMFTAERRMVMDKVNSFESAHRNWRQYPQEQRRKIATIMTACDSTTDRAHVVNGVLTVTRKALRAVERYLELSLKRLG